jgi:hypothetical protein
VFSGDGRVVAIESSTLSSVVISMLDTKTRAVICSISHANHNHPVLSYDGSKLLLLENDAPLTIWDTTTCKPVAPIEKKYPTFTPSGFTPDMRAVVVLNGDLLELYSATTGKALFHMALASDVNGAAVVADNRVELLGDTDAARALPRCRFGTRSFPLFMCEEKLEKGLMLAKLAE